jgi:hypothetical protein
MSYTAPSELCCTALSCAYILLSYTTPYWATPHPVELCCILLSYPPPPYWAMLYPSELHCTFWAMLHLPEPRGTLLSYTAPYWATLYPLSCPAHYGAKVNPAELHITPLYKLARPNWATLHPTKLCCTLLSYAVPYWATLFSTELRSTMWATLQPIWATFSTPSRTHSHMYLWLQKKGFYQYTPFLK